jgi:hypothetical protein
VTDVYGRWSGSGRGGIEGLGDEVGVDDQSDLSGN